MMRQDSISGNSLLKVLLHDLLSGEKQLLTLLMLEVDLAPLRDLVVELQETAKRQQRGASSTPMDIVDVIAIFSTKTHQCHHIL